MPTKNAEPIIDRFGRKITSLRVSVTDRCNFQCAYCMPYDNIEWFPHGEILRYEEMLRLIGLFAELGISRLKLTGGEPTVRQDLVKFIRDINTVPRIRDISLTTNGYLLDRLAESMREAGLKRITVSLDSLNEDRFNSLVKRNVFRKIYDNILSLKNIDYQPVKINVVVIKGFNDDEIPDFIEFARETGFIVRFIEFMPLDGDEKWSPNDIMPLDEITEIIKSSYEFESVKNSDESLEHGPAGRFRLLDGSAEFGLIPTVSSPFCGSCGRVRITPDGHLRTCLFSTNETDLKRLLREGESNEVIKDVISKAVYNKEEGHIINRPEFKAPLRAMYQIGG